MCHQEKIRHSYVGTLIDQLHPISAHKYIIKKKIYILHGKVSKMEPIVSWFSGD
jgi:hypothetical protein